MMSRRIAEQGVTNQPQGYELSGRGTDNRDSAKDQQAGHKQYGARHGGPPSGNMVE
jgi:hypothetical protein